jgi:hypothetical protein
LQFADGSIRTAWKSADGLQFVEDENGERVYGVWYIPRDESLKPIIVDTGTPEDL